MPKNNILENLPESQQEQLRDWLASLEQTYTQQTEDPDFLTFP